MSDSTLIVHILSAHRRAIVAHTAYRGTDGKLYHTELEALRASIHDAAKKLIEQLITPQDEDGGAGEILRKLMYVNSDINLHIAAYHSLESKE